MKALTPRNIVADPELQSASVAHYRRTGWTHVRGFFTAAEMRSISTCGLPEVPGRQLVYREASLLDPQVTARGVRGAILPRRLFTASHDFT